MSDRPQPRRTFARQKELGVIPADAELTPRHAEIPAWDEMPEELWPVLRRQMEVYAGFLEFTDHHVGRLLDALEELGVLEDTLVYYIVGDNGASAEGSLNGTYNEMINFNGAGALETPESRGTATTSSGSSASTSAATARCPRAPIRFAWSSTTPARDSARVAMSPSTSTGSRRGRERDELFRVAMARQ